MLGLMTGGDDELDQIAGQNSGNGEAAGLKKDQPSKQRYHKMMVVKKNQKFVAMVPLHDLKEHQQKDNLSVTQLTNRSRSSHRLRLQ